jgi:hypothetical protein
MPNRHERRRTKVFQAGTLTPQKAKEMLANLKRMCSWEGCEATVEGSLPKSWSNLVLYWSPMPGALDAIPPENWLRDAVLCPTHTQALDGRLLKDIGRAVDAPAQGSA